MGGQRELRWHEPEWHVKRVRSLREPTLVHGGYPNADTNCNRNSKRNGYRHPDGYGDGDFDCYSNANCNTETYSVTKTHSVATSSSHTGAASDTLVPVFR